MLTEVEARSLLATAATTVEVHPPGSFPEPPRRRHVGPLVAAAAAVLVVGGAVAVARHDHTATPPGPLYSLYRGDASFHLGPDQVPPVDGYPAAKAKQILVQLGYAVSEHAVPRCPSDGTVTSVSPQPGAIVPPGQEVALTVATSTGVGCPSGPPDTDPLLTWAEDAGPAPRFAARVWVEIDDARVATITGAARTQTIEWPGLRSLVDAATGVSVAAPDGGTPSYRVVRNAVVVAPSVCHGPRSICAASPNRVIEVHGKHTLIAQTVVVVNADGAIRGVDFIDDRATNGPLPDVLGDSAAYATARLEAFGYAVTEAPRVDCAPVGMVTKVALAAQSVVIGVTHQTGACNPTAP